MMLLLFIFSLSQYIFIIISAQFAAIITTFATAKKHNPQLKTTTYYEQTS